MGYRRTVNMILPESYIENMKSLLKDDFAAYMNSFAEECYKGIRFNRKKVLKENLKDIYEKICYPKEFTKECSVPWTDNGFYYDSKSEVSHHPYYGAGLYYIQEPSAMSPAAALCVGDEDYVLDLCAAPGGKATELATRAGFLLANDISASRAQALLKNLELSGNDNFAVCAENPEHLATVYPEYFDKILVDAPCSGEGMFRKEPGLIKSWEERGPEYYHELQVEILKSAYRLLKPGGMILYSTCTFSVLEDEDTLQEFMREFPDMTLQNISMSEHFEKGYKGMEEACRLFPHKIKGEGHFLALLQKSGESSKSITAKENRIEKIGDKLYLVKNNFDIKKGIRFLRTGLYLGEYKKDKFLPSTVYALSLDRDKIIKSNGYLRDIVSEDLTIESYILNLRTTDNRVLGYLKGNTIDLDVNSPAELSLSSQKGNCIICVDGYPLGYGRLLNGRIKNDYPQGYIWH